MLLVFLLSEITFFAASLITLLFLAAAGYRSHSGTVPAAPLLAALTVPGVLAALTALCGTTFLGSGPRKARIRRELAIRWSWRSLGIGFLIGVAGLLLTLPAAYLWSQLVGPEHDGSAVGEAFGGKKLAPPIATAMFLAVWLLAPVYEELLFRGVLWRIFEHWRWNRWFTLAITTLIFAIAHLELLRAPLLAVVSIPVGLARLITDNLVASVAAHQVNNFLPALFLFLIATGNGATA
ncbi:CPBP family intramembrane glutamic endopeptidase [Saccharopolyspora elongata]|uniref:CPBP family intramembrane metalloprotease n=1 Tax=Saccharopolyspora elongata TaxID=2530387 RepID=A0A4R4ZCQ6_9PSEU|nr:type II CAAX endopeptidase family protein [Saccharopolyspora elongata]TDD55224.1 CPBP family intramembrane metalloprotease [Saccharopolyspora elongata]